MAVMASETSSAVGSLPRRAEQDSRLTRPSEKCEHYDEDTMWASVTRRRGFRNPRRKGMSELSSCSTEAPNEIESVASSYALLVGDDDNDCDKDSDAAGDEQRSLIVAEKQDVATIKRGQVCFKKKGGKVGKERAGSGQKATKSRAVTQDEQEWPQETEVITSSEVESLPAVPSEDVCTLRGRPARSGSATRRSGSATPAMATLAFAAELFAVVAGIAPESHDLQVPKEHRRGHPRPQPTSAMQRPLRSTRGTTRQPLRHARGGRK